MNEKQKRLPKRHFYTSPEHEATKPMKSRRSASSEGAKRVFKATTDSEPQ